MVLLWYEYVLIAAIFATTLTLTAGIAFSLSRVRVQKWIGGAIGNFMTNLSKQAAKEEGGSSSGASPGALEPGGPKIMGMGIPEIMELIKLAQSMGFLKGGGGGGTNPFLKG